MAQPNTSLDRDNAIEQEISPHQMIAMLLDGALCRIDEAVARIHEDDIPAAAELVVKTINIINGLRDNLNMDAEGEIAGNLNSLYSYITERLCLITTETPLQTLEEVKALLVKVQDGWLAIETEVEPNTACVAQAVN